MLEVSLVMGYQTAAKFIVIAKEPSALLMDT